MNLKKGFTLIELLVVIAIIAILATLAVVAYSGAQVKSRDSKRVADIRSLASALANAAQDGRYLCAACGAISTAPAQGTAVSAAKICDKVCTDAASVDVTANYINLGQIKDPTPNAATCAVPPSAVCNYSWQAVPSVGSYTIGFWLEQASGNLNAGVHTANQNGVLQ